MTELKNESPTAEEWAKAWSESVVKTQDKQTQALIGGLNFRINVAKAFAAVGLTAKICFTAGKIVLTWNPLEIMGFAADAFSLVVTTLDALRERMHPLEYTACVVLSSASDGLTEQEFEQQLKEFLVSGEAAELPWYLGLTRNRLQEARKALEGEDGFSNLMERLREDAWLIEGDGKVKFKPRHFTWGVRVG